LLICENERDILEEEEEVEQEEVEQEENEDSDSGSRSPTSEESNTDQESLVQGRPIRIRREPICMTYYVIGADLVDLAIEEENLMMFITENDPFPFEEAHTSIKGQEAMKVEMKVIEKNNTWELRGLPKGVKPIGVKWVFRTKLNEYAEVEKHKARLVAKGYAQIFGLDYTEVFAPVAKLDTVRLILALAAQHEWEIFQHVVKSAFLHGELEEEVFIEQLEGFIIRGNEDKVYRLKKALYGLKQAPRAWYSKI